MDIKETKGPHQPMRSFQKVKHVSIRLGDPRLRIAPAVADDKSTICNLQLRPPRLRATLASANTNSIICKPSVASLKTQEAATAFSRCQDSHLHHSSACLSNSCRTKKLQAPSFMHSELLAKCLSKDWSLLKVLAKRPRQDAHVLNFKPREPTEAALTSLRDPRKL